MKKQITLWLMGVLVFAVCSSTAKAQDMTVSNARPIVAAIEKLNLEHSYRVPITYEDTLYVNDNEIEDATEEVRQDHDGSSLNRVFVPVDRTITISLSEVKAAPPGTDPTERFEAALHAVQNVLDSYAFSGGPGAFTVSQDASGLHVISRAFTNRSGQSQTLRPALDTRISVKAKGISALVVVEQITKQLSGEGLAVELGAVPMKLLSYRMVNVDIEQGTARDALETISKQIDTPLSWQLLCDPAGCALNLHVVP
jgi:hypothetical protein